MPKTLPALIFLDENHNDPFLCQLLAKITPRLKTMGFENFHFEYPAEKSIDDVLSSYNRRVKEDEEWNGYAQLLLFALSTKTESKEYWQDRMQHLFNQRNHCSCIPLFTAEQVYKIEVEEAVNIFFREFNHICLVPQAVISFLESLSVNQIAFKSIDDPELNPLEMINNPLLFWETLPRRDQIMVDAYLTARENTYGYIGFLHAAGIQTRLAASLSLEKANRDYCFIYPFACARERLALVSPGSLSIRDGKIALPLGLLDVDVIGLDLDQAAEKVMNAITAKITPVFDNERIVKSVQTKQMRLFDTVGGKVQSDNKPEEAQNRP